MPTDPIPGMLDRADAIRGARELIELACPLLQEIVNQGTHIHRRCESSASDESDIHLPAITLFRHSVELTDAIEVLLRASCVTPAIPLLRSCFEASLELGYLVQSDFRQRSLSWIYCHTRDRIRDQRRYEPGTDRSAEFLRRWEAEFGGSLEIPPEAGDGSEYLEAFLQSERFQPIAAAYESVNRRRPPWFQLFDGPGDRRRLAELLGRRTEYDVFYRRWSTYAHGRTYIHFLKEGEAGGAEMFSLRYPGEMKEVAINATNLMLRAFDYMLSHYRPSESLRPWYEREVQEDFQRLREVTVLVEGVDR